MRVQLPLNYYRREVMTLRKIRKIDILGRTYDVVWNKEAAAAGASFCINDEDLGNRITIGYFNMEDNKVAILALIMHEIKEIIQIMQGVRLATNINTGYTFVSNHDQHELLCKLLAEAVAKFIK